MKNITNESGFSAVELLITLFIAAIFLTAGYQLWGFVQRSGADADQLAKASNIAYDYLRQYSPASTGTCAASTPQSNVVPTNAGTLPNARVTVTITCPFTSSTVSKVTSTVSYSANPTKTVSHAIYAN